MKTADSAVRVPPRWTWILLLLCSAAPLLASAQSTLPPLTDAVQTAAGQFHTCALSSQGAVKCWGSNRFGQLGSRDAAPNQRETPVLVAGLSSGVTSISAGQLHTCAVLASGEVRCWGANDGGQLGDGTFESRPQPVAVMELGGAAIIVSAGEEHTCAVIASGGLRCWGRNGFGQLGDGGFTDRNRPAQVVGFDVGVTAIGSGHYHTCAVRNGGAFCWGNNDSGQLGDGLFGGRATPAAVSGLNAGVESVVSGRFHACARSSGGAVQCWGSNRVGQLGNGGTQDSRVPVAVSGLTSGVRQIAGNFEHSCAVRTTGAVLCWGDNFFGQMGDGSAITRRVPTPVSGLGSGIGSISAGYLHGCATAVDRSSVRCWGNNFDGQLGNASFTNRLTPRDVVGLTAGVERIATGFQHSCAWSAAQGTRCWGDNAFGQLGTGNTLTSETPLAVQQLATGNGVLAGGVFHTCSLTAAGGVRCWGQNTLGQVGDGSFTDRSLPVDVTGLGSGVTSLAAGGFHTCASLANGGLRCWGNNVSGQLGVGVTGDLGVPVEVTGLPGPVSAVSAGETHTCALTSAGAVLCWGNNTVGQLGDGTLDSRGTPTPVVGLGSGVRAISISGNFSCALLQSGGVRCWGGNESGQLGDGSLVAKRTPTPVTGLSAGIASIEAAWYHTCATTNAGALLCWGRNTEGQLGDNSTRQRLIPIAVPGLSSGVLANSGGGGQNCVLRQGGGLRCWGANNFGQIGDGSSWGVRTPVVVVVDEVRRTISSVTPASNNASSLAAIDDSGRFVAFVSRASNLVAGDTNGAADIFRRDRNTGTVARVSVSNTGAAISSDASEPTISGDGLLIAFVTADAAMGALQGESKAARDLRQKATGNGLFLRNLLTGSTMRVGTALPTPTGTSPEIAAAGGSIAWTQTVTDPTQGTVGQANIYRSVLTPVGNGGVAVTTPQCLTCRSSFTGGLATGLVANGSSRNPSLSDNGQWLAWETNANNIELTGTGRKTSPCPTTSVILLRNLLTGQTQAASTPAASGSCGSGGQSSTQPSVAADGGTVAFESNQPLVGGDINGLPDVYVWDAQTGVSRVSLGENDGETNGASSAPSLSADGSSVAFISSASNLDTTYADNNDLPDVHVAQLGVTANTRGRIARLSLSDAGGEADRESASPALSGDGSQLAFESASGNLAPGAVSNQTGIFVRRSPFAAATQDRSGVWWRASESGWGLVTADQGNALVLGWFSYAADGEPTWYSGALLPQPDGSYRGEIFGNTGVPLAQIAGLATETNTKFADARLQFSGDNGLQFDYQLVAGPSQSKTMQRFPFGNRRVVCRPGEAAQRLAASNFTDIWWGGSQTSGWGLFMTQIDAQLYPVWFTYDTDREAVFYTGVADRQANGSFSGSLFRSRNGTPLLQINNAPPSAGSDLVGSVQIIPSNGISADFRYTINGVSQAKRIERFEFGSTPPVCESTGS
ncbi:MAG: RCC1 domain-containing protein [Pseudomarimonas sp.]